MHIITKMAATAGSFGVSALVAIALPVSTSALVHTADIADNAVTSAKIAEHTIDVTDIGKNSVGAYQLQKNSVNSSEIKHDAVGNSEIADNAVGHKELGDAVALGDATKVDGVVAADDTLGTTSTGSYQPLAGDLTLEGAAGGTGAFQAAVMGHFHGDTLAPDATGNDYVYHGGVVGAYSATTSDTAGLKAGVIGTVGVDAATSVPDAAVLAVLDGGDGSATTADAAYGVAYTSDASGSHFTYGLDLYHAKFTDVSGSGNNSAVEYGTADIRLSSGATISSGGTNPTAACVVGSLFLNTGSGGKLYACTATTPTWTVVGTQS